MDYPPEMDPLPGVMVPQKVYTPRVNDRPNPVPNLQPIRFFRPGGHPGVHLQDVLSGQNLPNFVRDARTIPVLSTTGNRVSIRLCVRVFCILSLCEMSD